MYQLVKGRETKRTPRAAKARADLPEHVTKPINPWVVPEAPRRSTLERFGPAIACLVLIGLCGAAAWMSLTTPPPEGFRVPPAGETARVAPGVLARGDDAEGADGRTDSPTEVADAKMREPVQRRARGRRTQRWPSRLGLRPSRARRQARRRPGRLTGAMPADHGPKLVTPAGSAGLAAAPEGILLRFNSDSRAWERLTAATPLGASTRLLCLYPTRTAVMIGKTQAEMLGECEIRILPQSTDQVPAIELARVGWSFVPSRQAN